MGLCTAFSRRSFVVPILRKKNQLAPRYQGSRRSIFFLLLITVLLSLAFWFKSKAGLIWEKVTRSQVFTIKKEQEKELTEFLGLKPNLKDISGLRQSLELLLSGLQGKYGIYFSSLTETQELGMNQDEVFIAASVNKIPIMIAFFKAVEQGTIKEDEVYVLKEEDIQDYGTGSMRYQEIGTKYSFSQLIELAGKESDNTAAYVLFNRVEDQVGKLLDDLQIKNTSIEENTTTAWEMSQLLTQLYQDKLLKAANKDKLLLVLTDTDFEDRIPAGVPDYIKVAHKIGNEVGVLNDCGIILSSQPYVLCILTHDALEEEAIDVLPKISRLFWEFSRR
jgi:beta-lactamase class A